MHIRNENSRLSRVLPQLPEAVQERLFGTVERLNEIHLRANGISTYTASDKNNELKNIKLTEKDIADTVYRLCSGSIYAHSQELKNGYISFDGIRVGVCGRALYGENGIGGFSSYTSINIRIPHHAKDAADEMMKHISEKGTAYVGGILAVSPPYGGKTTFLRALAAALSGGFYENGKYMKKRVCIIDEREEIFLPDVFDSGYIDVLSSYPKAKGIEICTRVMSTEYIVCDEIGNSEEADAICDGASRGIIFAASCHGESLDDVIKRKSIRRLFDEGVFKTVCEIRNISGKRSVKVRSVKC